MKTTPSLSDLLERELTCLGYDTRTMLGDIERFIEFSESNIPSQKQRELQRILHEKGRFDDPSTEAQYRKQTLDNVAYRFDVSLTQRVRYAALTALITTIEWCLLSLKKRSSFPFPKKPNQTNEAVHILTVFNQRAGFGLEPKIELLESLVHTRNCVVHAAGLLDSYKNGDQLRQRISTWRGVKASSDVTFLGESIEFEPGFLQSVVADIRDWLPSLEREALKKELLQR